MTYRIARNGQVYGPYTDAEVVRYLASGNILAADLAQVEGSEDWVPVEELFPANDGVRSGPPVDVAYAAYAAPMQTAPALYPDPPDLPWWAALLLGIFTGGIFFAVWDVVESGWLRRIDKTSNALFVYLGCALVFFWRLPSTWHLVLYNLFGGTFYVQPYHSELALAGFVLAIVSRFLFRSELLRHFNHIEPVGLQLSGVMTFFFGGLYFQYKFNRINEAKRAMHVSVPG